MNRKQFVIWMISLVLIGTLFSGCSIHLTSDTRSRKSSTDQSTEEIGASKEPSDNSDSETTAESQHSGNLDYRNEMRKFVQELSAYMKNQAPGFVIIPQNGEDIVAEDEMVYQDYLDAVDGIGREDLLYGYNDDNTATPIDDREYMLSFLNIFKENGKTVLVIDYCSSANKVQNSYDTNREYGFVSFAADQRDLNSIPSLPQPIFGENTRDILQLSDVKNFLYIINPEQYSTKSDFLEAISQTNYDLVFVDLFFDESLLTSSDVAGLKIKDNGAQRLVICYMSIGEAEEYRYYWQSDWTENPPAWLDQENPYWEGNYKVKYWNPEWQQIIYGNDQSYAKIILDAGFDGVYLDIIDAYEYFEEQ